MKQQLKIFLTVLMISILYGTEVDLFIPSFPDIQKTFALSPFLVQLTLSINYIAYAACAIFAGSLGDRFNRRLVILYSLGVFVVGSICCVCAFHFSLLVFGRFLQGIGIAGPAVLAFVVISDTYPRQKQIAVLGLLSGVVTIAMAFAPVIGSYVNLYFNWRANFIILLIVGILSFIISYMYIPDHAGDESISLSPKAYLPLLKSSKVMAFIMSLTLTGVAYWAFIGMAPILYMDGLGVELKNFGYYQGAISLAFGIVSLLSPRIINILGLKNSLHYSLVGCFLTSLLIVVIATLGINSPLMITAAMVLFSIFVVFPVQIMFPEALHIVPNTKARVSALMNSLRLILTAGVLEVISYFYTGDFFLLGITTAMLMLISLFLIVYILNKKWMHFE